MREADFHAVNPISSIYPREERMLTAGPRLRKIVIEPVGRDFLHVFGRGQIESLAGGIRDEVTSLRLEEGNEPSVTENVDGGGDVFESVVSGGNVGGDVVGGDVGGGYADSRDVEDGSCINGPAEAHAPRTSGAETSRGDSRRGRGRGRGVKRLDWKSYKLVEHPKGWH